MKNFDDFISFANSRADKTASEIFDKTEYYLESQKYENSTEKFVDRQKASMHYTVIEYLRLYHEWLNS